jgi:hypothetical protein
LFTAVTKLVDEHLLAMTTELLEIKREKLSEAQLKQVPFNSTLGILTPRAITLVATEDPVICAHL